MWRLHWRREASKARLLCNSSAWPHSYSFSAVNVVVDCVRCTYGRDINAIIIHGTLNAKDRIEDINETMILEDITYSM
jgi:hypothetical protein